MRTPLLHLLNALAAALAALETPGDLTSAEPEQVKTDAGQALAAFEGGSTDEPEHYAPGGWAASHYGDLWGIRTDRRETVAVVFGSANGPDATEETVRRITACVNACAGIPTAQLKALTAACLADVHDANPNTYNYSEAA